MALQGTGIADLITTTLNNVEPMKFTDLTSDLQRYVAFSNLIKKHKTVFDTGADFRFDLMVNVNGGARFVGLYAQDNVNVPDVMAQATVPWRHVTWNWAIEEHEVAMNRSPRKIVDLTLTRRIASLAGAVQLFEHAFWAVPSSTNTTDPYGVPYWIVKSGTASTATSFTGATPSGYTTVAGISPTTYPRWQNFADQYTFVTPDDLLKRWYKAAEFTDFDTVVPDVPTFNTGDDMGYYTNYGVLQPLEEMLRNRNDNIGTDIGKYQGSTMFMNKPVVRIPQLEYDTTNPVYGINWGEFKCAALRGIWLKETKIPIMPGQHLVSANFVDCSFNFFTHNRRRHFVLATGTTLPA